MLGDATVDYEQCTSLVCMMLTVFGCRFIIGGVATHCLLWAVVALIARTQGLKAILKNDVGEEGAGVCDQEKDNEERQCNAGQRQSCTM